MRLGLSTSLRLILAGSVLTFPALCLLTKIAQGQNLDFRGELPVRGKEAEIAISPILDIWLCANFNNGLYHVGKLGTSWEHVQFGAGDSGFANDFVKFTTIRFFDKDRAIVTGNIIAGGPAIIGEMKGGIYRTVDGGESWELVAYGIHEWIYDAFVNSNGQAWIGGSRGDIYYSSDCGESWTNVPSPFSALMRTNCIFMADSALGVVGGLGNAIAITRDNCRTWKGVETPLDQHLYDPATSKSYGDRIEKLAIYDGKIIANQDGRIFWSEINDISWQKFKGMALLDFALDTDENTLCGISDKLQVVKFDEKLKAGIFNPRPLYTAPRDFKFVRGNAFVMDDQIGIYQISKDDFKFSYPFTDRYQTKDFYAIQKWDDKLWATTFNHIYNSTDWGQNWYRIGTSHFRIFGLLTKNANEAFIIDDQYAIKLFDKIDGSFKEAPGLQDQRLSGWLEKDSSLYLYGYDPTKEAGVVSRSYDRGTNWEILDCWKENYPLQGFIDNTNVITLISESGSIRRLLPSTNGYMAIDLFIADSAHSSQLPRFDINYGIFFPNEKTGYMNGWSDLVYYHSYKTEDGGKTWNRVGESEFPYRYILNYDSKYIGVSPKSVVLIQDDSSKIILNIDEYCSNKDCEIILSQIDDESNIFIGTNQEKYLLFEKSTKTWRKLK